MSVTNTSVDTCNVGVYTSDGTPVIDSVRAAELRSGVLSHGNRDRDAHEPSSPRPATIWCVRRGETGPLSLTITNSTIRTARRAMEFLPAPPP
jgi:hypothetical protein